MGAMWPSLVVKLAPLLGADLGLGATAEPFAILDVMEGVIPASVMSFIEQNRRRLNSYIEDVRQQELSHARISDERFE